MLEGLNARILLAKSRILNFIDPDAAVDAYTEAYSLGVNDPDLALGALFDDSMLATAFHEGAGLKSRMLGPMPNVI